jgi:hypothetical protein
MLKAERIELAILDLTLKASNRRIQYRLGDLAREISQLLSINASNDEVADALYLLARNEVLWIGKYTGLDLTSYDPETRDLKYFHFDALECTASPAAGRRQQELSKGNRRGIFISHISTESEGARHLKALVQHSLQPQIPVFVSSDYDSIKSGDWYDAIMHGLTRSEVLLVLLSPIALDARWINFEAGFGLGKEAEVIPVVWRSLEKSAIDMPLGRLHARSLADPNDVEALLNILGALCGVSVVPGTVDAFMEALPVIEANVRYSDLVVELFRTKENIVRMSLRNLGIRQVELMEAEMLAPQVLANNIHFQEYQPVLQRRYWTDEHGSRYVGGALTVHPSTQLYLGVNHLTPVLSREMGEHILDHPSIHLPSSLSDHDLMLPIRYCVQCKGRSVGPIMKRIADIPCREH